MVQIFERPELAQVEDLTLKLARAHNELKLAEQERTNMLANISHDLRAPLTGQALPKLRLTVLMLTVIFVLIFLMLQICYKCCIGQYLSLAL